MAGNWSSKCQAYSHWGWKCKNCFSCISSSTRKPS